VGNVILSISISLDGFIAALNDKPGQGLGEGAKFFTTGCMVGTLPQ
jgi:hypothetical protein